MIKSATCSSILKEDHIMTIHPSSADQIILPAHVRARLPTDLQVQVVRLLAQLAAHMVLAEEEHAPPRRKEALDALSSLTQQDPA